jgi:hypothetical protein
MSDESDQKPPRRTSLPAAPQDDERNVYLTLTLVIQALLVVGMIIYILRRDWENVFLTASVIVLTLAPLILRRQYQVFVPPEFQLISAAFVFLSLFLGSALDYYYTYWWWDIVLHTASGFLLGIVGFVALFLLFRTNRVPRDMPPFFICFFGVLFAVFLGVLWEIFEFIVDRFTTANMQSTETGVVDTMADLIVDTLGAIIVAAMAYAYMRTGRYSFIADGVRKFIARNPKLFKRAEKEKN